MSPRRNRPARPGRMAGRSRRAGPRTRWWDGLRLGRGVDAVEEWRGERWRVRPLPGTGGQKIYRCPGCDHEIRPSVPHVVVWPAEEGLGERRHWHTGCWRARDRRGPTR